MTPVDIWVVAFALLQLLALIALLTGAIALAGTVRRLNRASQPAAREGRRIWETARHTADSVAASARHAVARVGSLLATVRRRIDAVRHAVEEIRRPVAEEIPAAARAVRERAREARAWTARLARLRRAAAEAATTDPE